MFYGIREGESLCYKGSSLDPPLSIYDIGQQEFACDCAVSLYIGDKYFYLIYAIFTRSVHQRIDTAYRQRLIPIWPIIILEYVLLSDNSLIRTRFILSFHKNRPAQKHKSIKNKIPKINLLKLIEKEHYQNDSTCIYGQEHQTNLSLVNVVGKLLLNGIPYVWNNFPYKAYRFSVGKHCLMGAFNVYHIRTVIWDTWRSCDFWWEI